MKRLLLSFGVSLLILVGMSVTYAGLYYLLSQSTDRATLLTQEVGSKTAELVRATNVHEALSSLTRDEDALNQYLIGKEDIVTFLEGIQSVGKPFGASVDVLSVSNDVASGHQRINLSLTVTGTFDAVMRTLGLIEYGPYDSVINNVTLNSAGVDAKKNSLWTAAVTASVGMKSVSSATSTKPK